MLQAELFASPSLPSALPAGFSYAPQFLSVAEEACLLEWLQTLPFQEAQYKQWQARRRIVSYGGRYDFSSNQLSAAPPLPEWLQPLRARLAAWAALPAARIQHATVAEYPSATALGWHRDVPQFEDVLGVSLLGHARLRFRRWPPKPGERTACALELAPRSAYQLRGAARWQWQHALSPTKELRYSITFRTRLSGAAPRDA